MIIPAERDEGFGSGCQLIRPEELQPYAADKLHGSFTLELSQDAPRHFSTGPDAPGKMGPGGEERRTQEQVAMLAQDTKHAAARILVQEALDAPHRLCNDHVIESMAGSARPGSPAARARTSGPAYWAVVHSVSATRSMLDGTAARSDQPNSTLAGAMPLTNSLPFAVVRRAAP